ncbi:hypothetical protein MNBD_NITROSPINAE01-379 [hydrothermal vent metagenome]|uniref:Pyrrolo-quinoline quinone repeat domain-containing protein n=1 Tax=hydrothermal vent metagenome TaxID=652676 RepID=A0A3B1CI46_9ZZZZ
MRTMTKLKVRREWEHCHEREIESLSVAGKSGEVVMCDRRDRIILFAPDGKPVWNKTTDFTPVKVRITEDGTSIFTLSYDGYLIKLNRAGEILWDIWVTKDTNTIAIKSKGQSAVVTSHKGRFHVISSGGKRGRIVHTPEPVAHARISVRTGSLFCASPFGWVGHYNNRFDPLGEFHLRMPITEVEVSERGKKIFIPAREDGLNVVELESLSMTTYKPGFSVSKVAVCDKGDTILATGMEGELALMNMSGKILWQTKTEHSWFLCDMTSDGKRFIAVSEKGVLACYSIGEVGDKSDKNRSDGDFDYLEI